MLKKIVLATSNTGKIKEFENLLAGIDITLCPQSDFNVCDVEETGLTFIENALLKARFASRISALPAIADDSGLCVDALHGAPGIYSARYAGNTALDHQNMAKLLDALTSVTFEKRSARFYCVLVFLQYENDPMPLIAEGVWEGRILDKPQGTEGFGYDPLFYVPTHHCSAAELSFTEKMRLSHRGQASKQLLDKIQWKKERI